MIARSCSLDVFDSISPTLLKRFTFILKLAIWWCGRAWTVDKRTGALAATHSEPKAHSDRITASRWLGNYLYTGAESNRARPSARAVSLAFSAAATALVL